MAPADSQIDLDRALASQLRAESIRCSAAATPATPPPRSPLYEYEPGSLGPAVILTDGDVVFQPRKVERSGLFDDVEARWPAEHYVLVDDKIRILSAVKDVLGERLTTVFPRQGHYAHDPGVPLTESPSVEALETLQRDTVGYFLRAANPDNGLIAGVLTSGTYFSAAAQDEPEIREVADQLYRRVDWPWATAGGLVVRMGWKPGTGFLSYGWEGYSEAMLLYVLGLGSPTHPLPADSFDAWTGTYQWENLYDVDLLFAAPLFTHQLSHVWIDFRGIQDAFMREKRSDYFENSRRATRIQQKYALRNPLGFKGYGEDCWGITAGLGPGVSKQRVDGGILRQFFGYVARGIPFGPDDGTLAPLGGRSVPALRPGGRPGRAPARPGGVPGDPQQGRALDQLQPDLRHRRRDRPRLALPGAPRAGPGTGRPDDREPPLRASLAPDARVSRHRDGAPPRGVPPRLDRARPRMRATHPTEARTGAPTVDLDGVELLAGDARDAALLANVRPEGWRNPQPAPRYNLVVLGAGTAGLVTAAGAAALGAKVALVERSLLGGDCLNTGCVPSKALLRAARFHDDLGHAPSLAGSAPVPSEPDFAGAMERMRRLRAQISRKDSVRRFEAMGVDVFLGDGAFADRRTVEVAGATLKFQRAVIATGSHAADPPIEGLAEAGYLTNETVFNLTERPRRLLVVGGGPLGCEMAQAFARLGSEVIVAGQEPYFLPGEERDAAEVLAEALRRDGIEVRLNTEVKGVSRQGGEKVVRLVNDNQESTVAVDEILVGAGRVPHVEGLSLEAAGVEYDPEHGVRVNDYLRTTNRRIYAAGDVALERKYTHMADATARIVIQNALFWGRKKLSALTIPWCTYTDPEIAHVGLYVNECREQGFPLKAFTVPMSDVDRAVLDGEQEGFVKIHVRDGTDTILGATIVARHAGEMINEISLAMVAGIGLETVSRVIHSYPTQAEAIRKAGDAYNRTRLSPWLKALSHRWLAWSRRARGSRGSRDTRGRS